MDKIYPRRLRNKLIEDLMHPEVVLLTGMRQVGKTTTSYHTIWIGRKSEYLEY